MDQRAWGDTASGQTGRFLVIFRSQAKLPAGAAFERGERGARVVEALRSQADASQPAAMRQLDSLGASARSLWVVNALVVQGSRAALEAMALRADVARIESDRAFHVPLETGTSEGSAPAAGGVEASLQKVGAPELWQQGIQGQGVVVASSDTGVEWSHPAIKAQYRGWNGTSADHNYNWWDAVHGSLSNKANPCGYNSIVPCDDYGHGTHTVGTMVGGADADGKQIGMAPQARWIACRNMENGVGAPSTYLECLQFFLAPTDLTGGTPDASKSPDIIDNSYACPPSEGCSLDTFDTALEHVRAAGIFMAVSAGNEGSGCGTVDNPPGIEPLSFSVGAVDLSDTIAPFSSRGPAADSGQVKPNLVAPGMGIHSAWRDGGYLTISGTSMAAPHVAGAVALLWQAFPELWRDIDATTQLLEISAIRLPAPASPVCGQDTPLSFPNNVYGFGRLDVARAYHLMPLRNLYFPLIAESFQK